MIYICANYASVTENVTLNVPSKWDLVIWLETRKSVPMDKTLISFGHGYSAQALAQRLIVDGWRVFGTTRNAQTADAMRDTGVIPLMWGDDDISAAVDQASHVLTSIAPTEAGDPVLARFGDDIARNTSRLTWVGYLSTTGVYGDHGGAWVDETTPLTPTTQRGKNRVAAERAWGAMHGLPLHIFRLAGIYGPGRGPFAKVRNGTAQRIIKPGQMFSRIHVDDIANAVHLSMLSPRTGGTIYNLCDNDPAPPQDVISYAAELLGLPLPPQVDFATADLTPMARSFYSENKRVSNARIKSDLGLELIHPDYKSGLDAILLTEQG